MSVADGALTEGAVGGAMRFAVRLAPASGRTVTAQYGTADVTAAAGADYTAVSGTLTLRAGTTVATIAVPILDDTAGEQTETFSITLRAPDGATLSDAAATGTIADDGDPTYRECRRRQLDSACAGIPAGHRRRRHHVSGIRRRHPALRAVVQRLDYAQHHGAGSAQRRATDAAACRDGRQRRGHRHPGTGSYGRRRPRRSGRTQCRRRHHDLRRALPARRLPRHRGSGQDRSGQGRTAARCPDLRSLLDQHHLSGDCRQQRRAAVPSSARHRPRRRRILGARLQGPTATATSRSRAGPRTTSATPTSETGR